MKEYKQDISWKSSGNDPISVICVNLWKNISYERYEDSHGRTRIQGVGRNALPEMLRLSNLDFLIEIYKLGNSIHEMLKNTGITDQCDDKLYDFILTWVNKYGLPVHQAEMYRPAEWYEARPRQFEEWYPSRPASFDTWVESDQAKWIVDRWPSDSFDVMQFADELCMFADDYDFVFYVSNATIGTTKKAIQKWIDKYRNSSKYSSFGTGNLAEDRARITWHVEGFRATNLTTDIEYDESNNRFAVRLLAPDHISAARACMAFSIVMKGARICSVCGDLFNPLGKEDYCGPDCYSKRQVGYVTDSVKRPKDKKDISKIPKRFRKEVHDGKL